MKKILIAVILLSANTVFSQQDSSINKLYSTWIATEVTIGNSPVVQIPENKFILVINTDNTIIEMDFYSDASTGMTGVHKGTYKLTDKNKTILFQEEDGTKRKMKIIKLTTESLVLSWSEEGQSYEIRFRSKKE